jgi:hypothetical protein
MPIIPTLGRWRQEDCKFKATWAMYQGSVSKISKQKFLDENWKDDLCQEESKER